MKKVNKIYVTTMYRWDGRGNHSYVLYAGYSKSKAIDSGLQEYKYRGGKYNSEVIEFTPDMPVTKRVIRGLPEFKRCYGGN